MSVTYHSEVIPENAKDEYVEFDNVDFVLQFPNSKIQLNRIRITGELEVYTDAASTTRVVDPNQIRLDKFCGAHSLFENISVQMGGQTIDNILEYPRLVKMVTTATEHQASMNSSANVCELKQSTDSAARIVLYGEGVPTQPGGGAPAIRVNPDFSVKPLISLNQALAPNAFMPYAKSGDIRISVQMNRNQRVFSGEDMSATVNYKVKNLRLQFVSVPDDGMSNDPVPMIRRMSIKQSFFSQFSSISTNMPMAASAVSVSFLEQVDEDDANELNTRLAKPPNMREAQFLFNNASNEYISYLLRNPSEMVNRYIDSFRDTGLNALSPRNLQDNDGFGLGLYLGDMVDFSRNKFTVQLQMEQNIPAFIAYLYFHGMISL